MKQSEVQLYNKIKSEQSEYLTSIKKQAKLRPSKGNKLFKAEIQLTIQLRYFQINPGPVYVEILPAAIIPAAQTYLPVYLFGLTDYYGAYNRITSYVPTDMYWNPSILYGLAYGTIGANNIPIPIGAFNENVGDFALRYENVGVVPIQRASICIKCNNLPYGSLINSLFTRVININQIRIIVPAANVNQFDNSIFFIHQNIFGETIAETLDPKTFQTSKDFNNNIADIPLNIGLTNKLGFGFKINYDCQLINMILFVESDKSYII